MARHQSSENSTKFKHSAFELRKLRGSIYRKLKRRKSEEELTRTVENYTLKFNKFLDRYKSVLTMSEAKIWEKKISKTSRDVLQYCQRESQKTDLVASVVDNFEEIYLPDIPQELPGTENLSIEDLEKRLVDLKEDKALSIDSNTSKTVNSVDEEIEARLLRLKFFRQTWCKESIPSETLAESVPTVPESEPNSLPRGTETSKPPPFYSPSQSEKKDTSSQTSECREKVGSFIYESGKYDGEEFNNFFNNNIPNLLNLQMVVIVLVITVLKVLFIPSFKPHTQAVHTISPSFPHLDCSMTFNAEAPGQGRHVYTPESCSWWGVSQWWKKGYKFLMSFCPDRCGVYFKNIGSQNLRKLIKIK